MIAASTCLHMYAYVCVCIYAKLHFKRSGKHPTSASHKSNVVQRKLRHEGKKIGHVLCQAGQKIIVQWECCLIPCADIILLMLSAPTYKHLNLKKTAVF